MQSKNPRTKMWETTEKDCKKESENLISGALPFVFHLSYGFMCLHVFTCVYHYDPLCIMTASL